MKEHIDAFLSQQHIAVAGYSRNSRKFSTIAYQTLKEKGYQVYPVNPAGGTTPEGQEIYARIADLPQQVKALLIITSPKVSAELVQQALQKGIDKVWIQQMSDSVQARELLESSGIHHVIGRCILMHASPRGIHRFHRRIMELFGRIPK